MGALREHKMKKIVGLVTAAAAAIVMIGSVDA